ATVPVGALLGVVAPASVSDAEVDAYIKDFLDNFDWEAAAGASGPEPETVDAGGTRVRYLKMGGAAGTPLMFIHGYGGDFNNWMFNQETLAATSTTYAIDLPGHGGSTKAVGDGSLDVFVRAVLAFMDSQGIERAHLVGHSMGGATSIALARKAGDRVASLTLIAPAGLGPEINMDYIDGFISQSRAKKLRAVLEMLVADPQAITSEMVEAVIRFKRVDGVGPALEKLRDGLMPGGMQGSDLRASLSTLTAPVQVIWGKADQILPASHAEGLPGHVTVTIFDDAGHMPHMEKAAEVNDLIARLIA
ncbi:MAG: acetoin dehydrogenase dihydrolipoyllysine-residue acetyltransferase subunit, partial [Rhizobiales bacterium]|nr:acetoin dehydrogenase dihydrolipoyllysine-residue acetyltransferase subunit [Hyphomicrobiales bacterium]